MQTSWTAPRRRPGIAVQTHLYLAHGGVDNLRQLHAFLSDTAADDRLRLRAARGLADMGSARAGVNK